MIDIYVIHITDRDDRMKHIKNNFSKFSTINLIFVDAIKHEKGHIGCFLSHKKCIQIAKDNDMKRIIVIEDDCLPYEKFEERLSIIINYLDKNHDWDIFLGAVTFTKQ